MRRIALLTALLLWTAGAMAQRFYNLTFNEVRIDSLLPSVSYAVPLQGDWNDSTYTVSIAYPEFMDMTADDVQRYKSLTNDAPLPRLPKVEHYVAISRKQGTLETTLCPLVYRDGKYQYLVSFMLRVNAVCKTKKAAKSPRKASSRYAEHSVLATGKWAKISVSESGVYQLTEDLVKRAGFSDLSHVKVYGYGGNLQPEKLDATYLADHDDLQEVPLCLVGGKRLFYARGPVSWDNNITLTRTRNPYSNHGYYFITQSTEEPLQLDSASFVNTFYPANEDYHVLHEVDNFAWMEGGRNLYENIPIQAGASQAFTLTAPSHVKKGRLQVILTSGSDCSAHVNFNGKLLGRVSMKWNPAANSSDTHAKAKQQTVSVSVDNVQATNTITVDNVTGGPLRLDYISLVFDTPVPAPRLSSTSFPTPEYVYNITNQDLHSHEACDMLIIIPTSLKLQEQAKRLKAFHEEHDGLRVRILPADELFNEFSSGTPDANAYRRYLKMLYDRAEQESDMPRYLLLMGDGLWDNRLATPSLRHLSADDYLLCFESENSMSVVDCYVDDHFFTMLDNGEGTAPATSDKADVAVGRFPVTTENDARILVDKTIAYATNKNAGAWQNTLMFLGDDGNNNVHMNDVNLVAENTATLYPGYHIKKVMWDAYQRQSTSTGYRYPDVAAAIKQQQQAGALVIDYAGHGNPNELSHELVLRLNDFAAFKNTNLPLWVTASCDIMPFDGTAATIGETAVLNPNGGTMAFYGTTRTVYVPYNKATNHAFMKHVLNHDAAGRPITLGEATRLTRNELITSRADITTNKLHYCLLGDPALALKLPTYQLVVDSINGVALKKASALPNMKAGSTALVSGYVEGCPDFQGVLTATVRDNMESITCKLNNTGNDGANTPFVYTDRTKVLFQGNDSIRAGRFRFKFAVPKDINYSNENGLITLHAVSSDRRLAHGESDAFTLGGSALADNDSIGPSIYCYLNSPSFSNGGKVNQTPYFVAKVNDEDGLNVSGNGIGHDLQLIIDGEMSRTYNLNENFTFDFGSYTSGTTCYSIPELSVGKHRLQFRAWDILNNSNTAELTFEVVKGLAPNLFSVSCTENPASTQTTFIITHDRTGSNLDVELEIFDMSGRLLWRHQESGLSSSNTYAIDWNLTTHHGQRLQTGVYLYRARLSSDGSEKVSKAKKLVVIQ